MTNPPTPSFIVVSLHLEVEATLNLFRVAATVQSMGGGINLYNETFSYQTTWAEVIAWLGTLVSTADATTPVAELLS